MWHTYQSPRWWHVWVPLALVAGLLGLESQAPLSPGGHQVAQFLLSLLMYGVFLGGCGARVETRLQEAYERVQTQEHLRRARQQRRDRSRALTSPGRIPGSPARVGMDRTQRDRGDNNMRSQLRPALVALGIFTILTGLVYPLVVTGLAQVVFPWQANGSLIVRNGQPVGSALIGQPFDDPKYFWGRLSATSPAGYTAFNGDKLTGSSGSNYGPLNPALVEAAQARITALQDADPSNTAPIPVDLVTASGSGLDSAHESCGRRLSGRPGRPSPWAE